MDLYTRCPACDTTFRVSTDQLQASVGKVRCGQCQSVFDAFATLTADGPIQPAGQSGVPAQSMEARLVPSSGAPVADAMPSSGKADSYDPTLRPDPAISLYEWEFKVPEAPRHTIGWAVLIGMLSITLVAQAAYAFRAELMMSVPQTREYYIQVCETLGCKIGLPELSNYLHVEASDLKAVDAQFPGEVQLLALVRNRAPTEMAYPAFELTLTNSMEQSVARRVFLPADYLPPGTTAAGIQAGSEMQIQLFLDTGTLRAAGYRLYLFYP